MAFERALSPHLAARLSSRTISLPAIADWVGAAEYAVGDPAQLLTILETAGGAFSPLTLEHTNIDLCRAVASDLVILVAPDRLGVLHEVTSTSLAMAAAWRAPDCVLAHRATRCRRQHWDQCRRAAPIASRSPGL